MSDEDFQDRLTAVIQTDPEMVGITTGWVLIRASQSADFMDDGRAMLAYNYPQGQPIHVTRGLIEMARTNFDERSRHVTYGDDDE